ncbi:hypothetical protein PsorP6_012996 [Peronosclerospora sorghi]|uniref:Uncharacterized protein n=1 Tax=Peronosclerospora sorghi TaxID=230839 RepID=A0ACC0WF18_9STRA|nr:hypothetical protein PsorP6_012996 [Peronosclerospora sorghi]
MENAPLIIVVGLKRDAYKTVNDLIGIKESDTGLSQPSLRDLESDKKMMQEEQLLQVACRTKIINAGEDEAKDMIIVKQIAKFVVGLGEICSDRH